MFKVHQKTKTYRKRSDMITSKIREYS